MEFQQRRWPDNDGSPPEVAWIEKQRPEAEQQSVNDSQIGRTSTRSINDQELLFHKKAVSDDSLGPARPQEFGECC